MITIYHSRLQIISLHQWLPNCTMIWSRSQPAGSFSRQIYRRALQHNCRWDFQQNMLGMHCLCCLSSWDRIWHVVADFETQPSTRLPMSWGSLEMPLQLSHCGRYCLTILGAISWYQLSASCMTHGSECTFYIMLSSKSESRFLFQCSYTGVSCRGTVYWLITSNIASLCWTLSMEDNIAD